MILKFADSSISEMGEHPHPSTGGPTNGGAQQGTTTFSTDAVAVPYDRDSSSIDPQNDFDVETDDIKTIADFLAKPVPVASGTFSGANTWGSSLFSSSILSLLNAQPIWLNKLQGFLNVRGNVKFRLVINPTPFQQGLLRLTYFPCANQMQQSYASHMFNRTTISQLPGTYLNMNDNFCEITVPYLAPTSFLQRDAIAGGLHVDWGNVDITVFEIFRTGTGPAQVNWTLWMSVEDLELAGMVHPQMFEPQMAKRPQRAIDQEANSGKGPIATLMSTGLKVANALSAIPSLEPVTKPASWVLSALGSAAEALGWSKPTLSEGPMPVYRGIHWYMNNSDGNDNCAPLSLRTDNKISAITDASPGALDEMSFNFIKTRWSYQNDFQWTAARVAGDLLYDFAVRPSNGETLVVANGVTVGTTTPAGALSKLYNHWRGSMDFRIRLIKTGYHTGTLAITFVPGRATTVPTYLETSYMYRQIIDLQKGSDFLVDLPDMVAQDFLGVSDRSGTIYIHVVNPLIAPATCSSTIDVQVETRGGPDLVFTNPVNFNDCVPYVPQMDYGFEPQGVDTDVSGEATEIALSSRSHPMRNVHHATIANGEVQMSVLDILKAAWTVRYAPGISPSNLAGSPVLIPAGQVYARRWDGAANVNAPIGGDLLSFVSSWFAFHRGAERFRFANMDCSASNWNYRAMLVTNQDIGTLPVYAQAAGNATRWSSQLSATNGGAIVTAGRFLAIPRDNGGVAVQVPFYSRYRYCLNTWSSAVGATVSYFSNAAAAAVSIGNSTGITTTRSAGDDYQLSYFIGIPAYAPVGLNLGPFTDIS